MIKSMTGFASLTHDDERGTIGVTVRAVNARLGYAPIPDEIFVRGPLPPPSG